jgi:hypothetical protein
MYFPFPPLYTQLTLSSVLVAVFRVCGNGDYGVCYVSQHEEISTSAPCCCVAYQAPHAVAGDGSDAVAGDGSDAVAADGTRAVAADGTHTVAGDGSKRSPQTGARARAPRPPPVKLDADGQALRERLRAFRTQAVRKNYIVSTRFPATLLLSPRA